VEVYCKKCEKVLGAIPDEKIPPGIKKYATCHTCGEKILLFREPEPSQNTELDESPPPDLSLDTSSDLSPENRDTGSDPAADSHYSDEGQILKPLFSGSAGEYFRIWIVNVFLTIITLGIYGSLG
jgi:hypothetical protein